MFEKIFVFLRNLLFIVIDKIYFWRLRYKVSTKRKWKEVRVIRHENNIKKNKIDVENEIEVDLKENESKEE